MLGGTVVGVVVKIESGCEQLIVDHTSDQDSQGTRSRVD